MKAPPRASPRQVPPSQQGRQAASSPTGSGAQATSCYGRNIPPSGGAQCPRGQLGLEPFSLKPCRPLALYGGQRLEGVFLGCAHETPKPRGEAHRSPPCSWKPSELRPSHCEAPRRVGASNGRSRAWAHGLNATGPGSPAGPGPGRRKPPGATLLGAISRLRGDPSTSQKMQGHVVSWHRAPPEHRLQVEVGPSSPVRHVVLRGVARVVPTSCSGTGGHRPTGPPAAPAQDGAPARDRKARLLAGGWAGTGRRPCPLRPTTSHPPGTPRTC